MSVAQTILERLSVILDGSNKPYVEMMDQSSQLTDRFAENLTSKIRGATIAASAALAGMAAASVYSFSEFDDAMTKSTAILTGVTDEIRTKMEENAIQISLRSTSSARDLAEGYYFLASAGMTAEQAISALSTVDNFATAGAINLATATELLADANSALGMKVDDAAQNMINLTRVSDVLVEAGNAANASAEQFGDALTNKAGAALRLLNKDIEEGVAILAAYANQGTKGKIAGEQLSIVLRESANASLKEADAWKTMGISLYDANGKMLPIVDFIEQLEKKMGGMSQQQKHATFEMLGFRSESMGAIAPLLGMSSSIRDFEKQLRSAGGATQSVADKQMVSFSSQMKIFKNNVTAVAIEIGEILAPSILMMNGVIIQALTLWRGLDQQVKVTVVTFAKITAVAGPTIVMLSSFNTFMPMIITNIGNMTKGVTVLSYALRALGLTALAPFLPIIAISAAVVAAIAAIVYVVVGPEGIATAWDSAKLAVMNFVQSAMDFLANFTANMAILFAWVGDNWHLLLYDMLNIFVTSFVNMQMNQLTVIQTLIRLWIAFNGWLTIAIPAAFNYVFSFQMIEAVTTGILNAWEIIKSFAAQLVPVFKVAWDAVREYFVATAAAIANVSVQLYESVGKAIRQILKGEFPNPVELLMEFNQKAAQEIEKVAIRVGAAVNKGLDAAGEQITKTKDQIVKDFNKGASDINFLNTAGDIVKEGVDKLKSPLEGFKSSLKGGPDFIKVERQMEGLQKPIETATDATKPLVKGLEKTELQAGATAKAIGKIGDGVDGAFRGSSEALQRADKYFAQLNQAAAATKAATDKTKQAADAKATDKTKAELAPVPTVAGPAAVKSEDKPDERAYTQRDTMIEILNKIEVNTLATSRMATPANLRG